MQIRRSSALLLPVNLTERERVKGHITELMATPSVVAPAAVDPLGGPAPPASVNPSASPTINLRDTWVNKRSLKDSFLSKLKPARSKPQPPPVPAAPAPAQQVAQAGPLTNVINVSGVNKESPRSVAGMTKEEPSPAWTTGRGLDAGLLALRVCNFTEKGGANEPLLKMFSNLPLPPSLESSMEPIVASATVKDTSQFEALVGMVNEAALYLTKHHGVDFLAPIEAAAILLYTMDIDFFLLVNGKLRDEDRKQLKPFVRYIWLLLNAMSKCPMPQKRLVYRGVKADVSAMYTKGKVVTWNAFASCTTSLEALQQDSFIGNFGLRTMFSIELVTNRGRVISCCSFNHAEEEVLLPPNSRFLVESVFQSCHGLVIVHMKELVPLEPLLIFPGTVDDMASLQAAFRDCQQSLKTAVEENFVLAEEKAALLEVRSIINSSLEACQSQLAQAKEEAVELRSRLEAEKEERVKLEKLATDRTEQSSAVSEEQVCRSVSEKEEALQKLARTTKELCELDAAVEMGERQLLSVKEDLAAAELKVQELIMERDEVISKLELMDESLVEAQCQSDRAKLDMIAANDLRAKAAKEQAEAQQQLQNALEEHSNLISEHNQCQQQFAQMKLEMNALEEQLKQMASERDDAVAKLSVLSNSPAANEFGADTEYCTVSDGTE
jgi:hypothetical protein